MCIKQHYSARIFSYMENQCFCVFENSTAKFIFNLPTTTCIKDLESVFLHICYALPRSINVLSLLA